jgi:hypothetical protein
MEDIILRISRNYIFGIGGIVSLGLSTWLIKRYLSNTKAATNDYYLKQDEINVMPNIKLISDNNEPITVYIFWNGDMKSTYLLIDQLLQDKIIQPLYIERYTILKALEHDQLEKMTKEYNINKDNCNTKTLEYLADVARIKRKQSHELIQLNNIRKIILKQYPEFHSNFLPTRYITTITKDLQQTQKVFDIIKEISYLKYKGIELFESVLRYIKNTPNLKGRILIAYSKDSSLMPIIRKIESKIESIIGGQKDSMLELPLRNIDNTSIKYLATEVVKNDVMRYLLT